VASTILQEVSLFSIQGLWRQLRVKATVIGIWHKVSTTSGVQEGTPKIRPDKRDGICGKAVITMNKLQKTFVAGRI
jgi:hypothetical protein